MIIKTTVRYSKVRQGSSKVKSVNVSYVLSRYRCIVFGKLPDIALDDPWFTYGYHPVTDLLAKEICVPTV